MEKSHAVESEPGAKDTTEVGTTSEGVPGVDAIPNEDPGESPDSATVRGKFQNQLNSQLSQCERISGSMH